MNSLTPMELAIAVIAALVVVGVVIMLVRGRQSAKLRSRFGPEYDRTVEKAGNRRRAETELYDREKRVAAFDTRPLSLTQRKQFIDLWRQVQARFVDDPTGAVDHADVLLSEVMAARGYPVADFEHRADDLSVDHPEVVQNYRAGHRIALSHARGEASTEDLRQAMIHYRALFDELVNEPGATGVEPTSPAPPLREPIRH